MFRYIKTKGMGKEGGGEGIFLECMRISAEGPNVPFITLV
jgi:hypothetical protein